jgi:Tol biopolymer transport system component
MRLLAFHSDEYGDKNIWISTPDASRRVPLTWYGHAAQSPSWSPDGRKIFFVKKHERQPEGHPFFERQADIRVIDVKKALKDLAAQAKQRWKALEDEGAPAERVAQARQSYEDYRYFRNLYD